MSKETREITVRLTTHKYEDLPEWFRRQAETAGEDAFDMIEAALGTVLQIAGKRWYDSNGQQFLTKEPIVEGPILLG